MRNSENGGAKKSPGRLKREVGQISSSIMLMVVTLFVFALMVGLIWSPAGSSITRLGDTSVYGGVLLASLLIAYTALALRKAHQYASRLVLIGMVGLTVLLVGWALRSV
jgi:hypothetical protein